METFKELEDILYGPRCLDATIMSVHLGDSGEPESYLIELHEGYETNDEKVIYVLPDEIKRAIGEAGR